MSWLYQTNHKALRGNCDDSTTLGDNHYYNTIPPNQTDRRFLLCLWSLLAVTQSLMDPSALILHAEGNPTTDLLGIMMQAVSHEQAKRCKVMLSFPNDGIWGAWSHLSKIQWVTLYTCLWLSSHQTLWSSNLGCDILISIESNTFTWQNSNLASFRAIVPRCKKLDIS